MEIGARPEAEASRETEIVPIGGPNICQKSHGWTWAPPNPPINVQVLDATLIFRKFVRPYD